MEPTVLEIFLQSTQGMDEHDAFLRVLTNREDVEKEYRKKYGDGNGKPLIDAAEDQVHGI